MERLSVGDIVFVQFPFSDLSNYKLRPALVLAKMSRGDCILCQITSKSYNNEHSILLKEDNFESGSLIKTSFIRPDKLFTANIQIIKKNVAHLKINVRQHVVASISNILST